MKKPFKIEQVAFTDHATKRWNERVGPHAIKCQLNILLRDLIHLERVSFTGDVGIIDNDIYFHFIYDADNKIVIETVLGRISLKPLLSTKEYVEKRYIYLEVEKDVLQQQQLPPLTAYELVQLNEINEQILFNQLSLQDQQRLSAHSNRKMQKMINKAKQTLFKAEIQARKADIAEKLAELKLKRFTKQLHLKSAAYSSVFARPVVSEVLEEMEQKAIERANEAVVV